MALAISKKSIWVKILVMLCALALLAVFALPPRAHAIGLSLSYGLIGSILGALGFAAPSTSDQVTISESAYNSLSSAAKTLLDGLAVVTDPFGSVVRIAGAGIKLLVSELLPWIQSEIDNGTFVDPGAFPTIPNTNDPLSGGFVVGTESGTPYYCSASTSSVSVFYWLNSSSVSFTWVSHSPFTLYFYNGRNWDFSSSFYSNSYPVYYKTLSYSRNTTTPSPGISYYNDLLEGFSAYIGDPGGVSIPVESVGAIPSYDVLDGFESLDDADEVSIPVGPGSALGDLASPSADVAVPSQSELITSLGINQLVEYGGSIADDTHASLNIFQQIWTWLQSFWTNLTTTITGAISGVVEGISSIVEAIEAIVESIANPFAEFFTELLPSFWTTLVGTINGTILNFSSIWHYVVSWVGSLGSGFSLIRSIWSGLPYAMVVPIYASLVVVLVFFVFKRIFF